jgi:hypothetical protein
VSPAFPTKNGEVPFVRPMARCAARPESEEDTFMLWQYFVVVSLTLSPCDPAHLLFRYIGHPRIRELARRRPRGAAFAASPVPGRDGVSGDTAAAPRRLRLAPPPAGARSTRTIPRTPEYESGPPRHVRRARTSRPGNGGVVVVDGLRNDWNVSDDYVEDLWEDGQAQQPSEGSGSCTLQGN